MAAVPKIKRIKDREVMDAVKALPCLICKRPSDPCHVKSRGSGGDDVVSNMLNMCRHHHTESGAIGWDRFIQKHPIVGFVLWSKGWQIQDMFGVKKLVKKGSE